MALLAIPSIACGGMFMAYEYDLLGDYAVWAPDQITQASVVKKIPESSSASIIIQPMIYAFGWNDAYIIAKQHPVIEESDEIDTSTTCWFILEVESEKLHGPLNEIEYLTQRQLLNLPDSLDFTHTIDP